MHLHLQYIYTSNAFTPPMHLHLQCIYTSNALTPPMHLHLQCIYSSNTCFRAVIHTQAHTCTHETSPSLHLQCRSTLKYTHKPHTYTPGQVHLYTSNAVQRLNTHTNHILTHLNKSIFVSNHDFIPNSCVSCPHENPPLQACIWLAVFWNNLYVCMYMCMCMYLHVCVCVYVFIYVYIHINIYIYI
jgi:hypothetical protein